MSEYIPECLACGGPMQAGQERVTVPTGRGKSTVRYRHQSDSDCQAALRGFSRAGAGSRIDEPDYTEYDGARATLTSRHLREGVSY